jgi:hypothetical protein
MARLYTNENFPWPAAEELRRYAISSNRAVKWRMTFGAKVKR